MLFERSRNLQTTLLSCLLLVTLAHATKSSSWTSAHCKSCETGGTPAKEATCPASNPVSCTNISEPDYCCPKDNYCMWAHKAVVCCPEGCDCNPQGSSTPWAESTTWAAASSTWAPASTTWHSSWHAESTSTWEATSWKPSTTRHSSWHATSNTAIVTTQTTATGTATDCDNCEWNPTSWNGVYCSTIYADGGNLPTTARAACGVVLVKEKSSDTIRVLISWTKLLGMIAGLHMLGGFSLFWR